MNPPNAFAFESIEIEREHKLLSLWSDRIAHESALLFDALVALNFSPAQRASVDGALRFALAQDYGPRDLDRYYVTHPIRVARFLAHWLLDRATPATPAQAIRAPAAVLVAGLLHSAVEKDILSPAELNQRHGPWVAEAIVTLTVDRDAMKTAAGRAAYYARLERANVETQTLKILDKLDNLFILCINPDANIRQEYLAEIDQYLLPLARVATPRYVAYLILLLADNRRLGFYRPELK